MSAARIPMIGIVGGIGSGKTTLTSALQHYFRSERLDADLAGHRALRCADIKQELADLFGREILDQQGEIHRPALAAKVFGNHPEQVAARKQLERIVHPAIREALLAEKQKQELSGQCDLLLLDAALMMESGLSKLCDAIVFLDVPRSVRLARVQQRGWTEEEFQRREASQLTLAEKREAADFVLDLTGPHEHETIDDSSRRLAEWICSRFPQVHCSSPVPVN